MTTTPETAAPVPTVADLIEIHSGYGPEIEVNDADGRIYAQDTCRCGMPLGMHLSLEAHRAQEVEALVAARLAESFRTVRAQLARVSDELSLHDAPLHIQAMLDQVVVENSLRLGLPDPDVEKKAAALRAAGDALGLDHGADFFNEDGSAAFTWQRPGHRVTVSILHGAPYEVEAVPHGPVTPFRSEDPAAVVQEVMVLLAAGQDA